MVGIARDKRRAVVEDVGFINRTTFDRLFKSLILFPPLSDGLFVFNGRTALSNSIFHAYYYTLIMAGRQARYLNACGKMWYNRGKVGRTLKRW